MIIAFLPPERQFLTCFLCSRFKQFRLQLFQERGGSGILHTGLGGISA